MNKSKMVKFQFWSALILIIVLTITFTIYSPKEFLDMMGVTNTYLLVIVLSLFAGLVFLTSALFYGTIVALVLSGFNPLILGVVAGIGLFVGDSFVFYLGKKGREALDLNEHQKILKLSKWLSKQPYKLVVVFIVLYGLTPFPNEILMITLSVLGYNFKKIWLPILISDIILVISIGYLTALGVNVI